MTTTTSYWHAECTTGISIDFKVEGEHDSPIPESSPVDCSLCGGEHDAVRVTEAQYTAYVACCTEAADCPAFYHEHGCPADVDCTQCRGADDTTEEATRVTAPTHPADLLTRAADMLDELDRKADPAPWKTDGDGGVWPVAAARRGVLIADCNGEDEDNAALIATMRQAAEPVAAWLREAAVQLRDESALVSEEWVSCPDECGEHAKVWACIMCDSPFDAHEAERCHCWDEACAVARVILGEQEATR